MRKTSTTNKTHLPPLPSPLPLFPPSSFTLFRPPNKSPEPLAAELPPRGPDLQGPRRRLHRESRRGVRRRQPDVRPDGPGQRAQAAARGPLRHACSCRRCCSRTQQAEAPPLRGARRPGPVPRREGPVRADEPQKNKPRRRGRRAFDGCGPGPR